MHISARSDYAVQSMLAIAGMAGLPVKTADLAAMQNIPPSYLPSILTDLRRAGLIRGRQGLHGGYSLARPAAEISVGEIMRAIDGRLTSIRGRPAHSITYNGAAGRLSRFWQSVHEPLVSRLESTTLDELLQSPAP